MNNNNPKLLRITTVPVSLAGLIKGQHRYMTEQGFEVVGVSSSGKALDEVRQNEGIRTEVVEMTRTLSPAKDLKSLWQFYKLCRREKPTIVHSHTPKAGIVGMMGAWLARVPIRLHTVAGMPLMETAGLKRKLLNVVEKMTYAFATRVYPNSHGLYDFIVEGKYTKPDKLHVIANGSSNGIDTSFFSPDSVSEDAKQQLRQELGINEDDFVFVFVGRMVSDKGVNELTQAFENMVQMHDRTASSKKTAHLLLVGNFERELDPLLPETEKVINSHPYIHAVGFRKNVKDYFAISDALVFPSYREGFPNVVMQAAAMQLNAIVSDINGCNEIITNGDNGWIVPPKNVEQLQERMEWCMTNREESKDMGRKSRAVMVEKYERSYVWGEILKEYNELLVALR